MHIINFGIVLATMEHPHYMEVIKWASEKEFIRILCFQ